jgi:hypothetical protein
MAQGEGPGISTGVGTGRRMSTDDLDIELARILADCANDDDLQPHIIKHAGLLQRLVCCMVKRGDEAESRIRKLYADFADITVEHMETSRPLPRGKMH